MGELLIDAEVIVTPREMGGSTRLLSCTCTSCNTVYGYIIMNQAHLGSGKESQLDASGKTARVSQMLCLLDLFLMDFRKTVNIIVVAFDSKILRHVNDLDIGGDGMLFQELFALAMTETKENHINLVERHLACEPQIGLTNQSFVHIAHQIPCITLAVGKHYLRLRVVQQQANQLTARIACRTKNTNFHHLLFFERN